MSVEIFAVNISAQLNQPVDDWLKIFLPERQEKILSYRFNSDRNRTIWAELLARNIIAEKFFCPIEKVKIFRNDEGTRGIGLSAVSAKLKAASTLKLIRAARLKLPRNFFCRANTKK